MSPRAARSLAGFSIVEVVVSVMLLAVLLMALLGYGYRAQEKARATETSSALASMVAKVRNAYAATGSYATLDAATLHSLGIPRPFAWDGSGIVDAWGNRMIVGGNAAGAAPSFALSVGGASTPISADACMEIGAGVVGIADAAHINSGEAQISNGLVPSWGYPYKLASGVIRGATLGSGCAQSNPAIAFQFH